MDGNMYHRAVMLQCCIRAHAACNINAVVSSFASIMNSWLPDIEGIAVETFASGMYVIFVALL